jgi:hypothetical protein
VAIVGDRRMSEERGGEVRGVTDIGGRAEDGSRHLAEPGVLEDLIFFLARSAASAMKSCHIL